MDTAALIKSYVTMPQAISLYINEMPHKNRINCPFHGGTHYKLYFTDSVFYCQVCGAKGSVIDFVMQLFHLQFNQSLQKLNDDFHLNLLGHQSFSNYIKNKKLLSDKQKQLRQKENEHEHYLMLVDEYIRLDINKRTYKPTSPNEPLHPLFIEALNKIDAVEYELGRLEVKQYFGNRRTNSGNNSLG